jgi:hypothetical protein
MTDEARNTERHHDFWSSDLKLRHSKINFISGSIQQPSDIVDQETKMADMTLNEPATADTETSSPALPTPQASEPPTEASIDELVDELVDESADEPVVEAVQESIEDAEPSFIIDTEGSAPVQTRFAAPQVRASSPTPSDSSEEVILFAGRDRNRIAIPRPATSRRTRVETFDDKIKLVEDKLHHAQEELLEVTSHKKISPEAQGHRPRDTGKGRQHSRNQKPTRSARQAEEDALLADYIANIEVEVELSDSPPAITTMNQRDLGGSDDDIWIDEDDTSAGEAPTISKKAKSSKRDLPGGWDETDIFDLGDLSTSDEVYGSVQVVLSKRERKAGTQYLVVWDDGTVDDARWITHATLEGCPGASDHIKAFEVEERLIRDFGSDAEDSEDDSDDLDSDDGDLDDDQDDEADLVQRRIDRMTDEQIARLLAKQEELGMDANELLLFDDLDDDDDEDDEENFIIRDIAQSARSQRRGAKRPRGEFPAASALADAYDGFDVMDFDRPSLKKKPKGRKGKPVFDVSDSDDEFAATMQLAWANDREKKKGRKQEREELRAQGLLGKKNKGKPDMKAKYKEGMQMSDVEIEIRAFLKSGNTT